MKKDNLPAAGIIGESKQATTDIKTTLADLSSSQKMFLILLGFASVGISAYHGYKRNDSVGGAILWAILGALFPVVTPAVAFAQGFGKRKK